MIDKLSNIIFLIGLLILIGVHIEDYNQKQKLITTIWIIVSILFIVGGWILREIRHKEKYDYDYAYQSGKLVGGAVYASYPEKVPGLGWVI